LLLAHGELLVVGLLRRKSCNAKNEIQLGNLVVAFDLFWVDDKLFVNTEKCRLMQNGEKRSPLLEVDIYTSVRKHARRAGQRFGVLGG
jgi:hypothetical protein